MDIETIKVINETTPYLLCWYDGININSYFIADFDNINALLVQVLEDLAIKKYDNYSIYFHNLSTFFFLLKQLSNIKDTIVNTIINKGKMITIHLSTGKNIIIHFRDSSVFIITSFFK